MPSLAVIGHPVAHTRSPAMQTAALAELGLAGEWTYGALDIPPEDFEAEVAELAVAGDYAGVNVTLPHKEAALVIADEASEGARAIGAANTLTFGDGRIAAANTDAGGLLRSLPAGIGGGRALVLGAGGAARAVIWALARGGEGAPDEDGTPTLVPSFEVDVWNRTAQRAATAAAELGGHAVVAPVAADYPLVVNTTAVGLHGEDPFEHLPLAAADLRPGQVVVDIVYGEEPSALLAAAVAAGATTVDGLEMLVQQGALSLRIWTGEEPSLEAMRTGARR
ncbi:MAG TPA: shikimate dehydrogenase [Solirubrobacterales bacterium]|nr:shikimate dehydrogenase [Solirubrobacterales bacterium]